MRYPVTLSPDDNGTVLVRFPDFPEAITYGEDREDALARALDALETVIMTRMDDRETIPNPSKRGKDFITLPATAALKAQLYMALKKAGMSKAELGRRAGWSRQQVDRIFDIKHASRIDALEQAASVLSRQVEIHIV